MCYPVSKMKSVTSTQRKCCKRYGSEAQNLSPFTLDVRRWETVVVSARFESLTEVLLEIQ